MIKLYHAVMYGAIKAHIPTIVYVEDNRGDARLLQNALLTREYATQLLVFETGSMALRYLQMKDQSRDVPPPHCILFDDHKPFVNGTELLLYVRGARIYDSTPIYIFAAEDQYRSLVASHGVSPESFLKKPLVSDDYLMLADLLMRSATANRDHRLASDTDSKPEVHAKGALRRKASSEGRLPTQQ